MKRRLFAGAMALALSAGGAQATTINVSVFDAASYTAILGTMGTVVTENFEGRGPERNVDNGFLTNVGTFSTVGGTGGGGTVNDLPGAASGNFAGNVGTKLAIRDGNVYGRQSTTWMLPGGTRADDKFLDSNDTHGISWTVDIGSAFTKILLTLTDATDVGATMRITADGVTRSFSNLTGANGQRNGNIQTLVIDFGGAVGGATILFENFKGENRMLNDGFSVDDIAVSAVPLPAPALMLIAGLAGLAAFRRKRAAA